MKDYQFQNRNLSEGAQAAFAFRKPKDIVVIALLSAVYLVLSYFLLGFKVDQLILVILVSSLYFSSKITRNFILAFSVFLVYWIIFDYMKAFPNYNYRPVQIESLYLAERKLFAVNDHGVLLTPNEFWLKHSSSPLDILTGIFYLAWVPFPLLFGFFLYLKNRKQFFYFSLTFVWVNILGWIIYYSYPAAPPWYIQQYGFNFIPGTPGNVAGLARFDAFFNVSLFHSIYSKSSNVFAAMPSLHCAYPMIAFYYGLKNKMGLYNLLFAIIMVGIWFSAVYTSHHFVLDVLAGMACAVVGITSFELVVARSAFVRRFVEAWTNATT